jgi:hypothetical protein
LDLNDEFSVYNHLKNILKKNKRTKNSKLIKVNESNCFVGEILISESIGIKNGKKRFQHISTQFASNQTYCSSNFLDQNSFSPCLNLYYLIRSPDPLFEELYLMVIKIVFLFLPFDPLITMSQHVLQH